MSRTAKYIVRIVIMMVITALIILFAVRLKPDPKVQTAFKIKYDLLLWYYDETLTPYLESFQDAYFKETGKRVETKLTESLEFFDNINKKNVEGEGAPDLYIIDSTKLENAYLSSLAKPNEDPAYTTEHFLTKALNAATYKEKLVAYPLCFNTSYLAYNTDLVANAPVTFKDITSAESEAENILEFDSSDLLYNSLFIGAHINLGGEGGDDASAFDLSSEKYTKSLSYMQKLGKKLSQPSNLADYGSIEKDFIQKKTAMGIFSIPSLVKLYGSGTGFQISKIPDLSKSLPSKAMSQTSVICINPDSRHTADAEELARFLSFDNAGQIFENCGLMSTVKSDYDNADLNTLCSIYEDSFSLPKLIETENIWENLNLMLRSVWDGEDIKKAESKLNVAIYVALSTRTEQEDR